MSASPVKAPSLVRSCMRDRIRDVLVTRILDGHYPAGTQLKELTLAREFNVSQAPIREALRELEGSGLVTSERYRGTRVRGTDLKEMRESYELRATLEIRALELAIPCAPEEIDSLDTFVGGMAKAAGSKDAELYIDNALGFHRSLIEASGNRIFLTVWDSLHFEVRGRIALRRVVEHKGSLTPFVEAHAEVVRKIRARDVTGATALLRTIFEDVAAAFG